MTATPFELDIAAQADALLAFADAPVPSGLDRLADPVVDRIVFTGMGSSHFAALPTWRLLVAAGLPAWWVDTATLLDTPQLVSGTTLLVATSQSGASGEVVAALDALTPRLTVGITNDTGSPLARHCDVLVPLHSGSEATVSTKSYLNTLAAQRLVATAFGGYPADVADAAAAVRRIVPAAQLAEAARGWQRAPHRRSSGTTITPLPPSTPA